MWALPSTQKSSKWVPGKSLTTIEGKKTSKVKNNKLLDLSSKALEKIRKTTRAFAKETVHSIRKTRRRIRNLGRKEILLRVNDNPKDPHYGLGFSVAVFRKKEWIAMKKFCNHNQIFQTDLNSVFRRYLSDEEAILRDMQIAIFDIHNHFSGQSQLIQEISNIYFPQIFLKDYEGLLPVETFDEIPFARVIILAAMKYLILTSNLKNSDEVSIENLIKFGLKYPLMFYPFHRFQKLLRRYIFGDIFWAQSERTRLPSIFPDIDIYATLCDENAFENEAQALRITSQSIIYDIVTIHKKQMSLSNIPVDKTIFSESGNLLTTQHCLYLKEHLGYKAARNMILDSQFQFPSNELFMQIPLDDLGEKRGYDAKMKRDFTFDLGTGMRAWIQQYVASDGETVLKETAYKIGPPKVNTDDNIENLL
eukprot:gene11487-24021_t